MWGPGTQTVTYHGGIHFERTCPKCGRFVKPDATVWVNGDGQPHPGPNAICARHGRIAMPFLGYY